MNQRDTNIYRLVRECITYTQFKYERQSNIPFGSVEASRVIEAHTGVNKDRLFRHYTTRTGELKGADIRALAKYRNDLVERLEIPVGPVTLSDLGGEVGVTFHKKRAGDGLGSITPTRAEDVEVTVTRRKVKDFDTQEARDVEYAVTQAVRHFQETDRREPKPFPIASTLLWSVYALTLVGAGFVIHAALTQ